MPLSTPRAPRAPKAAKAALAVCLATALLAGGAGTIAFWSDSATADGGGFASGRLSLSESECDPGWTYLGGSTPVEQIVPGDSLVRACELTLTAEGDNLSAALTVPDAVTYADPPPSVTTDRLDVSATYTLGGEALPRDGIVTDDLVAERGGTLRVRFRVDVDFGDATTVNANDTQGWITELDALSVSLVQQDS